MEKKRWTERAAYSSPEFSVNAVSTACDILNASGYEVGTELDWISGENAFL